MYTKKNKVPGARHLAMIDNYLKKPRFLMIAGSIDLPWKIWNTTMILRTRIIILQIAAASGTIRVHTRSTVQIPIRLLTTVNLIA